MNIILNTIALKTTLKIAVKITKKIALKDAGEIALEIALKICFDKAHKLAVMDFLKSLIEISLTGLLWVIFALMVLKLGANNSWTLASFGAI